MFGEKLKELRKSKGLTQKDLAKELGFAQGFISSIENGDRNPGIEFVTKIKDFFELQGDDVFKAFSKKDAGNMVFTIDKKATETDLAYYSVAAGVPLKVEDNEPTGYVNATELIIPKDCKQCVLMKVKGDSMTPKLQHGDWVVVDFGIEKGDLVDGAVYIVQIPEFGVTCKRVFFTFDALVFKSFNPDYPEFNVPKADWADQQVVIGKIVKVIPEGVGC